jgi:hypothetical protein
MAQRNEHIAYIRKRIINGMTRELVSLRGFLSSTDGNRAQVEMLRGERGTEILAKLADTLLTEFGWGVMEPPTAANSAVRRDAQGKLGDVLEVEAPPVVVVVAAAAAPASLVPATPPRKRPGKPAHKSAKKKAATPAPSAPTPMSLDGKQKAT